MRKASAHANTNRMLKTPEVTSPAESKDCGAWQEGMANYFHFTGFEAVAVSLRWLADVQLFRPVRIFGRFARG
jgi:hypothetical protein